MLRGISIVRAYAVSGVSHSLGKPACSRLLAGLAQFAIMITFGSLSFGNLSAQDLNLSPTRPTIANGVTIQDKGVLQVETGYDAYPQSIPGNQQTVGTSLYYVPLERLRLDLGWSAFSHQESADGTANGVSTLQVGERLCFSRRITTKRLQVSAFNMRLSFPRLPIECFKASVSKSFCS